jgi:hypothetical protein
MRQTRVGLQVKGLARKVIGILIVTRIWAFCLEGGIDERVTISLHFISVFVNDTNGHGPSPNGLGYCTKPGCIL